MSFRRKIRKLIRSTGYDVHKLNPRINHEIPLLKSFEQFEIDLVLDVGANTGQFAQELRLAGYKGRIVSFEPLSKAHAELCKAAQGDPLWDVYPRCALGDTEGTIDINIAGNSVSSSILPMLELHSSVAKESVYIGTEKTDLHRLENIASTFLKNAKNPFLKLDTQGFEHQVLEGSKGILPQVKGILCELSLVPLYDSQVLWKDMLAKIEKEGFVLWAIRNGFANPANGRSLQFDGVFFKE
jgi:FkbM family methyltransferase